MSVRLQADSTIPSAMPDWVDIKSFYVNGSFKAPQSVIDAWHGPKVLINVTGNPADGGDAIDVEAEDAGPGAIPAWYDEQHRRGTRYLTVYSNRDNFAACTAAINGRFAHRWLATLDGTVLTDYEGHRITSCQCLPAAFFPTNMDGSLVFDPTWHPGTLAQLSDESLAIMRKLAASIRAEAADLQSILIDVAAGKTS